MRVAYTFSIIRYTHDPIAGESLNVGVLLHSQAASFLDIRLEYRYERISKTFAGFDGERFKQVLAHFENAVAAARDEMTEPILFIVRDSGTRLTATDIGRQIWRDPGASFRMSEPMTGVGENLPAILLELFDRFVASQYERDQSERVSDDQVWSRYRARIAGAVAKELRPKEFETPDLKVQFDHAFQNERWHVLQPLSMDYTQAARIQDKAAKWLGVSHNLKDLPEAARGKYYFLLHPPELAKHRAAYIKAKNILHKMPLEHELVEEDEVEALSRELLSHLGEG